MQTNHTKTTMDNVVDETTDSGSVSIRVSVFLKWTKKLIEFEITIPILPSNNDDGSFAKVTGKSFKDIVYLMNTHKQLRFTFRDPLVYKPNTLFKMKLNVA